MSLKKGKPARDGCSRAHSMSPSPASLARGEGHGSAVLQPDLHRRAFEVPRI